MRNIEKKRLNGVLKFLNTELVNLSPREDLEIAWNLGLFSGFLYGDLSSDIIEDGVILDPEYNPGPEDHLLTEIADNLPHIQAYLNLMLDSILEEYGKAEFLFQKNKESYFPVGLDLFKLFEFQCPVTVTVRVLMKIKVNAFLNEKGRPQVIYSFQEGQQFREAYTGVEVLPSSQLNGIPYLFLHLLRGIRLSEIRQCRECGARFVPLTARKAEFCGHKCSSRYGMRSTREKLRAENPLAFKEHKAKERARSKKSYYGKFEKGGQKIKRPS
jgi:hypothetical protein